MREAVGFDDEYQARQQAYQGDGDVPSIWTPEWCQARMVEAYRTLALTPMRIWPKDDTGYWPQTYDIDVREEFPDLPLFDMAEIIVARRKHALSLANTRPDGVTIEQASRMNEALECPLRFLGEKVTGRWAGSDQIMRDAVTTWAYCEAYGFSLAAELAARYRMASAKADAMAITGGARTALFLEIEKRCKAEIASDLRSTKSRRARIVSRYKAEFRARSRPQPHEVVKDLCLTPSALAKWRQRGFEEIAKGLRRAQVPVR